MRLITSKNLITPLGVVDFLHHARPCKIWMITMTERAMTTISKINGVILSSRHCLYVIKVGATSVSVIPSGSTSAAVSWRSLKALSRASTDKGLLEVTPCSLSVEVGKTVGLEFSSDIVIKF